MSKLFRYLPVVFTIFLGIIVSLYTAKVIREIEIEMTSKRLNRTIHNLAVVVQDNLDGYAQTMYSIQSLYASFSDQITQAKFTTFIEPVFSRLPGIDGFDIVIKVPANLRTTYEESMINQNYNFQIYEENANGQIIRAGDRSVYFPITLSEPAGRRIIGYDVNSNFERRNALETALKSQKMVTVNQVTLTTNYQPGFLLFLPIYSDETSNLQSLQAVAIGSFSIADTIQFALQGFDLKNLDFITYETKKGAKEGSLVFYNSQTKQISVESQDSQSGLLINTSPFCQGQNACTQNLVIGNQQWSLVVIPSRAYELENQQWTAIVVFWLGILLTIILASYLLTSLQYTKQIEELVNARENALKQLERQTIELHDANQEITLLNQQLQEQLDVAEVANQAKSNFIANISHELRSPLNAILGFSQLMLRNKNLPQEQSENAGIIHRSGEYLLTLINNVLDFAKIEAGKTTLNQKDFDLHQLLDDLEDMLHLRAVNQGLELIFDRAEDLPRYIHSDGVKLRQVLLNLLSNAIKFTKEGGVVLRANSIFNDQTENYTLDFNITDTGVGIAPAELSKLFEAFSQTKSGQEAQEGSGLGLAISRQFVQLMGGDITVSSELGKGTTFQFSIQVELGETTASNRNSHEKQVLGLAPDQPIYKILAVDDKPVNCQLLIKLLAPLGFDVKQASNGKEAIEIWEAWQPHLIFMDMRMPVMDGYEATKYIKGHVKGSATAVIALTASVLEEEKAIVLSAGCDDFIRKPFKETTIFNMLNKYLGVTYIYEEITEFPLEQLPEILTGEDFKIMSQEWLERFLQANLEADDHKVLIIMQEIPETEIKLIKGLNKLVHQYEFDKIIDLVEPLINHE